MIGERVSQNYIVLRLSNAVVVARTKLDENPGSVAIIFDDAHRPVTIVTAADLAGIVVPDDRPLSEIVGQLPPGVVTDVAVAMEDFVDKPEFAAFGAGARGAMVFDRGRFSGVLPQAAITQYLRDEYTPASDAKRLPSYSRPSGHVINKPIIMYCDEFNHRNELNYYDRRKPPQCRVKTPYPHPIRKKE